MHEWSHRQLFARFSTKRHKRALTTSPRLACCQLLLSLRLHLPRGSALVSHRYSSAFKTSRPPFLSMDKREEAEREDFLFTRLIVERAESMGLADTQLALKTFDLLNFSASIFSMGIRTRLSIAILIVCSRKSEYFNIVFDIIQSIPLPEEHQQASKTLQLSVLCFYIVYKIFEIYNLDYGEMQSLSEADFSAMKAELLVRMEEEVLSSTCACPCDEVQDLKNNFLRYLDQVHTNSSNYADVLIHLKRLSSAYDVRVFEEFIKSFLALYHPILQEFKVLLEDFIDAEELRKLVVNESSQIQGGGVEGNGAAAVHQPFSPEESNGHTSEDMVLGEIAQFSSATSIALKREAEAKEEEKKDEDGEEEVDEVEGTTAASTVSIGFGEKTTRFLIEGAERIVKGATRMARKGAEKVAKIVFSVDEENTE